MLLPLTESLIEIVSGVGNFNLYFVSIDVLNAELKQNVTVGKATRDGLSIDLLKLVSFFANCVITPSKKNVINTKKREITTSPLTILVQYNFQNNLMSMLKSITVTEGLQL